MTKQEIKQKLSDVCDARLKLLGKYDIYKDSSLEDKFYYITGLVNNDIEDIIDSYPNNKLDELFNKFNFYVPSGAGFESSNKSSHDYSKDYLTTEALESGTIGFIIGSGVTTSDTTDISYRKNGGEWITTTNENGVQKDISVSVISGDKIEWKGTAIRLSTTYNVYSNFNSICNFNIYGNSMSLLYGDDFKDKILFPSSLTYIFSKLFCDCKKLISTSNLILPAITLTEGCYESMFKNCTSLTTAPELPATTLAEGCYDGMFSGCTSLTTAPVLPATTLGDNCYQEMFYGCTSLTTAPELPATTLVQGCYNSMFGECENLNYIKAMFTTTPDATYTCSWVWNVAETGTFVRNENATWNVRGDDGVPEGWDVEPPIVAL